MATTLATLTASVRTKLMELSSLSTPSAPTVTPTGTTGATSYGYKVEALNHDQTSIASAAGTTTTGNAALSTTNYNHVTWVAVTGATGYRIYRTVGGATQGVIAWVGNITAFDDTGIAADGSSAPTLATGGNFWTDAEILEELVNGAKDLWAAILDTFGDHFFTVAPDNTVTLAASATQLSGVPTDCFRVHLIEPQDTSDLGSTPYVKFVPRKYNHPDFIEARAMGTLDPTVTNIIFYDVTGAGTPVGTPVILTAPKVSSTINLRFAYNPVLGTLTSASNNPIPGESDKALIAYAIAFTRSKERDDRSPDPNWLAVYSTEKQGIIVRITPRQDQESEVADGLFAEHSYGWPW